MNKKIILTDVDGVLLRWSNGFMEFMKSKGYNPVENAMHHYRLVKWYPEFDDSDITNLVKEFNTSKDIAKLEPWKDAVPYVRKLHKEGYHFICITAMGEHPNARKYREENLDSVFGYDVFNHNEMICLPCRASKHNALSSWAGTGYHWIDDHFRHAESGYELGLRPILMDNEHNSHFATDLFPRATNWEEVYKMITKEESYINKIEHTEKA